MTLRRKIMFILAVPLFLLLGLGLLLLVSLMSVEGIGWQQLQGMLGLELEYVLYTLAGGMVLLGLVMLFTLDRVLLARLSRLSQGVSRIGVGGDFSGRLSRLSQGVSRIGVGGDFSGRLEVKGKDELSTLAEEINSMLVTLEYSRQELEESERRFKRITDNMLDLIAQLDLEGNFVYVSPSHRSVLGYRPGDLVEKPLLGFVHGEDQARVAALLQRAAALLPPGKMEFRLQHARSNYVWVEAVSSYLKGPDGQVSGIILSSRDITERMQAEEALRKSEEKHRVIVTTIEEGYYEVDREGNFTFFNDSLCRITGYSRQELRQAGSAILSRVPGEVSRAFQGLIAAESPATGLTWKMQRKDGSEAFVEASVSPVKDQGGETVGFRGLVRDVTQRKLAEEKIKRLNEELEQRVRERTAQLEAANRELEAFSYSVSHDLRAPLRSIDGFSTALLEDYSVHMDETARDYLQRVRGGGQRMGQLIDDLLNLSRVTRSEMCSVRVNLSQLAAQVGEELQEAEPGRAVELVVLPRGDGAGGRPAAAHHDGEPGQQRLEVYREEGTGPHRVRREPGGKRPRLLREGQRRRFRYGIRG